MRRPRRNKPPAGKPALTAELPLTDSALMDRIIADLLQNDSAQLDRIIADLTDDSALIDRIIAALGLPVRPG